MKTPFLFALALAAFTTSAYAADQSPQVSAARFNTETQSIEVDISHGGGCVEHVFKLEMGGCLERGPLLCSAKVIDVTGKPDPCRALFMKTISFKLADYGLSGEYYASAWIRIHGAFDSSASVQLP